MPGTNPLERGMSIKVASPALNALESPVQQPPAVPPQAIPQNQLFPPASAPSPRSPSNLGPLPQSRTQSSSNTPRIALQGSPRGQKEDDDYGQLSTGKGRVAGLVQRFDRGRNTPATPTHTNSNNNSNRKTENNVSDTTTTPITAAAVDRVISPSPPAVSYKMPKPSPSMGVPVITTRPQPPPAPPPPPPTVHPNTEGALTPSANFVSHHTGPTAVVPPPVISFREHPDKWVAAAVAAEDDLPVQVSTTQHASLRFAVLRCLTRKAMRASPTAASSLLSQASVTRSPCQRPTVGTSLRQSMARSRVRRSVVAEPVRIFVGTWNTEYGDFPAASMGPKLTRSVGPGPVSGIDAVATSTKLRSRAFGRRPSTTSTIALRCPPIPAIEDPEWSPPSMVVGVEDQSDTRRKVVEVLQKEGVETSNQEAPIHDYSNDEEFEEEEEEEEEGDPMEWTAAYRQTHAAPTKKRVIAEKQRVPPPLSLEPLSDWLPNGYDVYVISLQESVSDKLNEGILAYLNRASGRSFTRIRYTEDRISGLGDGAYLSLKSTTVAAFAATELLSSGVVAPGTGKKMSLSSLNGSKGAVAITLQIHQQLYCFVSCHLPAGKDPVARRKARDVIRRQLAEAYSGYPNVSPTEIFHHLIWTGDFNLRVKELSAEELVECLYKNMPGATAFDEFQYEAFNADFAADGFEEMSLEFRPTYKQIVGRPPLDKTDPFCYHRCYNLHFKVQWYKGGKVKERIPSWTDRVFKWSHKELKSCLLFLPGTYQAADPPHDSLLLQSDHAPVGCGFRAYPSNSPVPAILFVADSPSPSLDGK